MKHLKTLVVLALAFAFAAPAYAQTQNVKVSGSLGIYAFARGDYDLKKGNDVGSVAAGTAFPSTVAGSLVQRSDTDTFLMSQTQLQVAADLTDNVSTVVALANERDWNADIFGTAGTTSVGDNQAAEFDVELTQAYVTMKEIFYSPLTIRVGRQPLWFGRGFIIGNNSATWDSQGTIEANEYSANGAFDAIRATLDFNPWTVDFVYSKIAENNHNPEDDRDFWFTNVNYKFSEYNAVAEGYFMADADRGTLASSTRGTENNTTYTLGGRAQFDPISQMTLGAELAYQGGHYMIAVTNPRERDRQAWGADLFGTYRFENAWKPEVTVEYVHFSGEDDLSNQSLQGYGAWNLLYRGKFWTAIEDFREVVYQTADTADQGASTNHDMFQLQSTFKPMNDLKLLGSVSWFWNDATVHTTSNDPGSAGHSKDIGTEIDLQATYDYTEDVSFGLLAAWFIPGNYYVSGTDSTATDIVSSVKVAF
ncbi:MAG: alginate export family protein [Candidatus Omnitrophica bacterium]|nr:alginate export family protein [Candidatus Omnitrophota bacterium]